MITEEEVTVEAGTFTCLHYVVSMEADGKAVVTHLWFAQSLPGAPVLLEAYEDEILVQRMELISHVEGGGAP